MTWHLAKKELLANLITMRFSMCTALFLALVMFFSHILISDYRQKLERYNGLVTKNSEELRQLMTYQNLKPTVYKPPEVLSIFSKGVEDNITKSARISIDGVPVPEGAYTAENPLLSVFTTLDITMIFSLIISLLTLLVVYDAISGEKGDKTLALMLSNGVPRHQVLLGKFLGSLITLTIPITIGFLVVGLFLLISPEINLSAAEWGRVVLMYLVSLIMVGALLSLGLFVSSMTRQAADTLIILFFLWVIFALAVPNLSTCLATRIKTAESRKKIDSQISRIWKDFETEKNREFKDFIQKNPQLNRGYSAQSDVQEPWGGYHSFATKHLIRVKQALNTIAEPLKIEYADKKLQVDKRFLESLKQQKGLADIISLFSPLSTYEIIISGLSRSDLEGFESFYEQAGEYRRQLIGYLYDKKAFSLIRYFATVKEEHLVDIKDYEEYSAAHKKYNTAEKAQPLNTEDVPWFLYQRESLAETIKRILPGVALLSLTGILLFLCAFVAFLKYDVR